MPEGESVDNCVFIAKKRTMKYVFSVMTQAKTHNEIRILARGKSISRAVDVSQISVSTMQDWGVKNVKVGTHAIEDDKVSFIEIVLNKKE